MAPTASKNHVMSLSELLGDRREVTVKWLDHEFVVTYKPSATTPEFYAKTRELSIEGEWGAEAIVYACAQILASWSLVDEQGDRVPITDEWLRKLPNQMLFSIYNTCQADLRPKENTETNSNGS